MSLRGPQGRGNLLRHKQEASIASEIGFVFSNCLIATEATEDFGIGFVLQKRLVATNGLSH